MPVIQRQIVIHPANTRHVLAQDVKPGMVIVEGVVTSVLTYGTELEIYIDTPNATVYADRDQRILVLATIDNDVLEAIRSSM